MCILSKFETDLNKEYNEIYQANDEENRIFFLDIITLINSLDKDMIQLKKKLDNNIKKLKDYQNSNNTYFDFFKDLLTTNPINYLNYYDFLIFVSIYLTSYSISTLYSYVK